MFAVDRFGCEGLRSGDPLWRRAVADPGGAEQGPRACSERATATHLYLR